MFDDLSGFSQAFSPCYLNPGERPAKARIVMKYYVQKIAHEHSKNPLP